MSYTRFQTVHKQTEVFDHDLLDQFWISDVEHGLGAAIRSIGSAVFTCPIYGQLVGFIKIQVETCPEWEQWPRAGYVSR